MKTMAARTSAHPAWRAQARRWMFGVGALGGIAFAPSAQAIATFSASTDFSVSAEVVSGAATVTGRATVTDLTRLLAGTGAANPPFSSVGAALGDSVSQDLLTGALEVTASVDGSATPPGGSAEAYSWHDVEVLLANTADPNDPNAVDASVLLTFVFSQVGTASTTGPGETAYALSAVEFDDFLNLVIDPITGDIVGPTPIIRERLDTTVIGDFSVGPTTVTYLVNVPVGETGEFAGVVGAVDAQGAAAVAQIPEPATALLFLAGLAGLGYARRRSLSAC